MPRDRIRPEPVSCQSCRAKKLKCNRAQPCSNCTARGITCNFLIPPKAPVETTSTLQSNAELLERINRLESIVLKQQIQVETRSGENSGPTTHQQPTPISESDYISVNHGERDEDTRLLQDIGTREDSLVSNHQLSRLHPQTF
jgi:hypothetical protein